MQIKKKILLALTLLGLVYLSGCHTVDGTAPGYVQGGNGYGNPVAGDPGLSPPRSQRQLPPANFDIYQADQPSQNNNTQY